MTSKKLLWIASFNQSFHWFIIGLIIPITVLLQQEKGLDLLQIGFTTAVYAGAIFLFELPTGGLSDAIGRKRVYIISLVMFFLSALIILFTRNMEMMVIGFAFFGLGRALSSGSIDAWFVDEFYKIEPEGNLQAAIAKMGIFIPIGLGLGALLGGYLPMSLGKITSQIPGFDIYSGNLIAISVLIIVQFFLTIILVKEQFQCNEKSGIWSGFKDFPEIVSTSIQYGMKNHCIFMLLISTLAWGLAISGLELLWQPQVKGILGLNFQPWICGVISTGFFLASALGNIIITPLCKLLKEDYRKVLVLTRILMGTFLMLLVLQEGLPGFIIFYWTLFAFNGMSNSPHAAILNSQVPSEKRSTLLSFESFSMQIGNMIGALIMGFISKNISISVAWLIGALILIFSSFAYIFMPDVKKSTLILQRRLESVIEKTESL